MVFDYKKATRDAIWDQARKNVPKVENNVPIWRYIDQARHWHKQIHDTLSKLNTNGRGAAEEDMRRAFYHLAIFLELVVQGVRKHNGFSSPTNKKV